MTRLNFAQRQHIHLSIDICDKRHSATQLQAKVWPRDRRGAYAHSSRCRREQNIAKLLQNETVLPITSFLRILPILANKSHSADAGRSSKLWGTAMSKRRHRQPLDVAPPRGPYPEVPESEPPLPREGPMDDAGSAKLDIADAIAKEIDMTWVIIAVIEILLRESSSDKYAQGGLRLAHAHLDGLCAIQRDLDRVWQSE